MVESGGGNDNGKGEGGRNGKENVSPTKGGVKDMAIGPGIPDGVDGKGRAAVNDSEGPEDEAVGTGGIDAGVEGFTNVDFKKNWAFTRDRGKYFGRLGFARRSL